MLRALSLLGLALLSSCASRAAVPLRSTPPLLRFDCRALSATGHHPFGVVAGDWNDDGRVDLLVSYAESGEVATFLNQGDRLWVATGSLVVGPVARGLATADIDGDGIPDAAVALARTNQSMLLRGRGDGTFRPGRRLGSGVAPFANLFSDIDGDGRLDLVVVNESNSADSEAPGNIALYFDIRAADDSGPIFPVHLTVGQRPSHAVAADLDGDGDLDIAVSNWWSADVSLLFQDSPRRFREQKSLAYGGTFAYSIAAADLDHDGDPDLVVTDVAAGGVRVLRNDGNGDFAPGLLFAAGSGARSVAVADLDTDGRADLLTANTAAGTISILRGRGDLTFEAPIDLAVGPQPRIVIASDFDGDGWQDIAVTAQGADHLAVLYQSPQPTACRWRSATSDP